MSADAFSKRHPIVNFLFFLVAIGFGVMIQHPAYLAAGFLCSAGYYLLLSGRKGLKKLAWVGTVAAFVSNFFRGQGIRTPWQMLAYGGCGMLMGFLLVLLFAGPLLDTCNLFMMPMDMNLQSILAMYGMGFSVNVSQGISTFIILFLLGKPLLGKLERIKLKYGMEERL